MGAGKTGPKLMTNGVTMADNKTLYPHRRNKDVSLGAVRPTSLGTVAPLNIVVKSAKNYEADFHDSALLAERGCFSRVDDSRKVA
jgi:hypothetical protein